MSLPTTIYAREYGGGYEGDGWLPPQRVWRPPTDQPWSDETVFVQKAEADELERKLARLLEAAKKADEALADLAGWLGEDESEYEPGTVAHRDVRAFHSLRAAIAECEGGPE